MKNPNTTNPVQKPLLFPRWVGRLWLWAFGWTVTGDLPDSKKYVLIAAPHTSNWDFPFMIAVAAVFRVRVSWMGKDSLFKHPLGGILRRMGGIPIDRSKPSGVVLQVVRMVKHADALALVVPPSGTRKKRDYWKSGFYWIAHTAKVPIVCAYLDFGQKRAHVGLSFTPTGDVKADMDRIREFFSGVQAKYPELTTRIRLREEDKIKRQSDAHQ